MNTQEPIGCRPCACGSRGATKIGSDWICAECHERDKNIGKSRGGPGPNEAQVRERHNRDAARRRLEHEFEAAEEERKALALAMIPGPAGLVIVGYGIYPL